MVVVEHGIDHGRTLGLGVGHEIADRVVGSSKKARMIGFMSKSSLQARMRICH
jgi:hypothetical protein